MGGKSIKAFNSEEDETRGSRTSFPQTTLRVFMKIVSLLPLKLLLCLSLLHGDCHGSRFVCFSLFRLKLVLLRVRVVSKLLVGCCISFLNPHQNLESILMLVGKVELP